MTRVTVLLALTGSLALTPVGQSHAPVDPKAIGPEVSIAEIERTLHAIDVDRTAGSDGERAAADYLDRTLTSYVQGLGVPFFSIGVPGPGNGSPDVDAAGRIAYWHAPDDTIDKLDLKALELDTQYRVAQPYDLATMRTLPHVLTPIAASYSAVLTDLAAAAGSALDLRSTIKAATAFEDAANRFDRAAKPQAPAGVDAFNALVVRLTHTLNSTLYTKTGRFDQDPAAASPVLPLLARAKDLAALPRDGDNFGFLVTTLTRGRNIVEATLRDCTEAIDAYLSRGR